jgi:hypothetical protein
MRLSSRITSSPNRVAGHLARAAGQQLVLDAFQRGVDLFHADRALAQRQHHRGAQLGGVELDARAVLLHHRRHRDLDAFVGGEALVAVQAAAAAADDVALVGLAGLDDLGFVVAQKGQATASGQVTTQR